MTFSPDGRMFIWEKTGHVWTVDYSGGVPVSRLLLDISEEVNSFWDRGLLGLALDPDFLANPLVHEGFIYLAYVVDWEYYTKVEVSGLAVDPALLDKNHDTFSRLVRYHCSWEEGFTNVTCDYREVLIGATHDTGIPSTSGSHTADTLVFAPDGTLLLSAGDGAFWMQGNSGNAATDCDTNGGPDLGSPCDRKTTYSSRTAEIDGILSESEKVGAFRAQLVNSHNGKILRLDPLTGGGVPSNPFYNPEDPFSPRSRIWSMGLRNPYRFSIRPGTGSANSADGNPGVLYIGDVGWSTWEELSVARAGGVNFGWPIFEGLTSSSYINTHVANLDTLNPLSNGADCNEHFFFTDLVVQETLNTASFPNPCNTSIQIPAEYTRVHKRPVFDWMHSGTPTARVGTFDANGLATTTLIQNFCPPDCASFGGASGLGGIWYSGMAFPPEYRDKYFFADSYYGWIRSAAFDSNDQLISIKEFIPSSGHIPVMMATDPNSCALYYVHYGYGASSGEIWRVFYDANSNGVLDSAECPVNTAPQLDLISNQSVYEGSTLTFSIHAADADGDAVTLSAKLKTGEPIDTIGAAFVDHGNGYGTFTWAPSVSQADNYELRFSAADGATQTPQTVLVSVHNLINSPPAFGNIPQGFTVYAGQEVRFNFTANDPENLAFGVCGMSAPDDARITSAADPTGLETQCHVTPEGTIESYPHNGPGPFTFSWIPMGPTPQNLSVLVWFIAMDEYLDPETSFGFSSTSVRAIAENVAPVINNVNPTNGLYTTNRYTSFTADLSDNIRLKNAELRLDGQVVRTWTLGQISQTIGYSRSAALNYGWHTYALNVWDPSNNLASVTRSFYVYSSGGGGGGCFLAGTPISMADGTTRPIEKVSVGEIVIAYNQETGRLYPGKVSHVIEIVDQKDYLVINGFLNVTPEHRFLSDGHWVKAGQLRAEESTITDMENQPAPVISIEHIAGTFTVYNLEVDPYHSFIASGIIVHNGEVKQMAVASNNVIITK